MTPDQYRREGAEAMRKAALEACEDYAPERNVDFPTDPFIAQIAQVAHSMDRIRALDVDEVLTGLPEALDPLDGWESIEAATRTAYLAGYYQSECGLPVPANMTMLYYNNASAPDAKTEQTASSCQPPQHGDETYYSKGKTAEWWVDLTDEQFAWELICATQDLNDTGLGDDLDKWMPHQVMLADAAKRIKRLSTADTEAMARLRTENERLRTALRPFAAAADDYCDPAHDDDYSPQWAEFFVVRDFRRAQAALAACKGVRDAS